MPLTKGFRASLCGHHQSLQPQVPERCPVVEPSPCRWALFFVQFIFHVTYLPGSKNTKADTLSGIHVPSIPPFELKPILPNSLIVGLIQWALYTRVDEATTSLLCQLIDSLGLGHPGKQQTLSLIQNHYWWLSMSQDVQ